MMPHPRYALPALLSLAVLLLAVACGPATVETVIEPIEIRSVEVEQRPDGIVLMSISGVLGDSCSRRGDITEEREGDRVTVNIYRVREIRSSCRDIGLTYETALRLPGDYPPGEYTAIVNDVETTFVID